MGLYSTSTDTRHRTPLPKRFDAVFSQPSQNRPNLCKSISSAAAESLHSTQRSHTALTQTLRQATLGHSRL